MSGGGGSGSIKGPKARRSAKNARVGKYKAQRVRTERNKLAACVRHVDTHPNDSFGADQLLKRRRGI